MGSRGPAALLPTRPVPYPRFDGTQHCLEIGVEAFCPSGDDHAATAYVKQTCTGCPLIVECREFAISYDVVGVWGGTTYADRRRARRKLGIKAIPITDAPSDDLRIVVGHLDDGYRSVAQVAAAAGCSPKTVERYRKRRRTEGEAA